MPDTKCASIAAVLAMLVTASARADDPPASASAFDPGGPGAAGTGSDHSFHRINPAAGISYQPRRWLGAYASYSESNRAPTAVELTCASRTDPCRLPNAFLGDPPLAQVVARTVEVRIFDTLWIRPGGHSGKVMWKVHTTTDDTGELQTYHPDLPCSARPPDSRPPDMGAT